MGSTPSSEENRFIHTIIEIKAPIVNSESSNQPKVNLLSILHNETSTKKSSYLILELQTVIKKAHKDLHSKDPIGKKRYFFQVVNFIFQWLNQSMKKGMSLYDAECMVSEDLLRACKQYPIGQISKIQSSIKDLKPAKMPNLIQDIEKLNKEKFTDRLKELCIRSKEISYEFNKKMQLVLQKEGGFDFKGGHKNTGVKAYMRILTKILEDFMSSSEGSKQVYKDMDHYYWTPIFTYFNTLIDQNQSRLNIQVYDWIRCRVFYKRIEELQQAYKRLSEKFGPSIFRVKNRINLQTRDVLINLKYKTEYAQIQLALSYDSSAYDFNHKLYELTRERLGVAYCCFTILLNEIGDIDTHVRGVMTKSGYIKKAMLRQKIEDGFQRLTRKDAEVEWESIVGLLEEWDVVALDTGVVRGVGFDERLSGEMYGPEMAEMLVIKRRSNDALTNWLNWMN